MYLNGDLNGHLNGDLHSDEPAENQETKLSQTASSYDLLIALAKIGVIVMYAFLCDR